MVIKQVWVKLQSLIRRHHCFQTNVLDTTIFLTPDTMRPAANKTSQKNN